MKKLLVLLVVSVIGGAITLGTYKIFLEKEQKVVIESTNSQPVFMPTNMSTIQTNSAISQDIDFVEAAEKTVDAVVHVMNTTISRAPVTIQDLFFGRGTERAQIGTGSGVIISPDGYIVTNNHVIDGAQSISVTLNDNRTLSANLVGADPRTDIALLKIESDEEAKKKYDLEGGAYVFKTNNYELFKRLGLKNGYIITDINDIPINNIEDIQNFKNKFGNNSLEKSIDKIGVINTKGQRERFIFK